MLGHIIFSSALILSAPRRLLGMEGVSIAIEDYMYYEGMEVKPVPTLRVMCVDLKRCDVVVYRMLIQKSCSR
jgi:hypothetical protein